MRKCQITNSFLSNEALQYKCETRRRLQKLPFNLCGIFFLQKKIQWLESSVTVQLFFMEFLLYIVKTSTLFCNIYHFQYTNHSSNVSLWSFLSFQVLVKIKCNIQ